MIATQSVDELNGSFAVDSLVTFEPGEGGLARAAITAQDATAHICIQGAHVTHWRPPGSQPVLWLSDKSWFEPGRPIRGGVPVCLPWFNLKPDDPDAPRHGFARTTPWRVVAAERHGDGSATLCLALKSDEDSAAAWPHEFEFQYRVTVGEQLGMSLRVSNTGDRPFAFTEALHTYFNVADVRQASVTGLEHAAYLDTTGGRQTLCEAGDDGPITFAGETDRIYTGTAAVCVLRDPVLRRRITIAKSGSNSTVVWNPWIEKAAAMADFGDDEWSGMLCIETANVREDAVALAPGESHTMTAGIEVDDWS